MRVTVKLFGPQAVAAGRRAVDVEMPDAPATCAELRRRVAQACPVLAACLPTCRLAINHEFADDTTRVVSGDEVALIGPVSGG